MAKAELHIRQLDFGDQLLIEGVVALDVGDDHAQEIIDLPAHAVELDNFGKVLQGLMELVEPFLGVLARSDGDEHRHSHIDLLRVEKGHAPLNDAALLELLDAPPARRCRKPDLLADFGDRHRAVLLQDVEDPAVHSVEHG